jgi:hypothetical protein
MTKLSYLICVLFNFFVTIKCARDSRIICRKPDVTSSFPSNYTSRRFVLYDREQATLGGLGNYMVFFPVAYSFATLSGRDIAIPDHSVTGATCRLYHCGLPFVSELKMRFPQLSSSGTIFSASNLAEYLDGTHDISDAVINPAGFLPYKQGQIIHRPGGHECLAKVTSCKQSDWLCYDLFMFAELFRGPFSKHAITRVEKFLVGGRDNFWHHFLHKPLVTAPRIDVALHLRLQLEVLESNAKEHNAAFDSIRNFSGVHSSIPTLFAATVKSYLSNPKSPWMRRADRSRVIPRVFISCDDAEGKRVFIRMLGEELVALNVTADIMYMENERQIVHTKHAELHDRADSMLESVFDWVALGVSETIFMFRRGSTASTFAVSASYLTDRSVVEPDLYPKLNFYVNGKFRVEMHNEHPLEVLKQSRNYQPPAAPANGKEVKTTEKPKEFVRNSVLCRRPNISLPTAFEPRRFVSYDHAGATNGGLGNIMIFYPVAYTVAALSGRDIVIPDNSVTGAMCRVFKCSFPFVSDVKGKYPVLEKPARSCKFYDYYLHFRGELNITDNVVSPEGWMPYQYGRLVVDSNEALECISNVTNCPQNDGLCYQNYMFGQLFRGPFAETAATRLIPSLVGGIGDYWSKFLNSTLELTPRIDIALHVRMQLNVLEVNEKRHNNSNSDLFYNGTNLDIPHRFAVAIDSYLSNPKSPWMRRADRSRVIPRIFISCDDAEGKRVFIRMLGEELSALNVTADIMYMKNSREIMHTKHAGVNDRSDLMLESVFDWVALGVSDTIFMYRRVNSVRSTFSTSAAYLTDRELRDPDLFPKLNSFNLEKRIFEVEYFAKH